MANPVTTHSPSGPCVSPLFAGVHRTRANQPLPSVSGPRQSWRTTMSKSNGVLVSVKIIPNEQATPAGKLADAEVVFEADAGPLSGLKLIGFAIWERRDGGRNVTFPARQYTQNGERRSFVLLRPVNGERSTQEAITTCILDAYTRVQAHA
jgi:hypothetical protein